MLSFKFLVIPEIIHPMYLLLSFMGRVFKNPLK